MKKHREKRREALAADGALTEAEKRSKEKKKEKKRQEKKELWASFKNVDQLKRENIELKQEV